jgi:hypothetical protein
MNEMLNNPFGLTKTEIYIFGLGREHEQDRIIKLLKDRWIKTMDESSNITAMGLPVDRKSAILVTEALIWAVEEMND